MMIACDSTILSCEIEHDRFVFSFFPLVRWMIESDLVDIEVEKLRVVSKGWYVGMKQVLAWLFLSIYSFCERKWILWQVASLVGECNFGQN